MQPEVVEIEQHLGPSARCAWNDASYEEKMVITRAFYDIGRYPEKVRRIEFETGQFGRNVREWVDVFTLEIGFVTFLIANPKSGPIILAFDYDDPVADII